MTNSDGAPDGSSAGTPNPDLNQSHLLVVRSTVPSGLSYLDYLPQIRYDFFYSCGYCTLSEFEAQGIAFQIDHYEPRSDKPELENQYDNLIYSCSECNNLKGDLTPPINARLAGFRFFRPDVDVYDENFTVNSTRVIHLTNIGEFTIETLNLNRQSLRRLREIRSRLEICDEYVARGIMELRHFKIDQLPREIKGRTLSAIQNAGKVFDSLTNQIDEILRESAQSPLLAVDPEKAAMRDSRSEMLDNLKVLYPEKWRGRKNRNKKNKRN